MALRSRSLTFLLLWASIAQASTIAIIDTGFDLDHEFLRPKILKQETDEETVNPKLEGYRYWFHDNSHLKEPVIKDQSLLQEILLYRNLRAKGHQDGLSISEFEWFKKKSNDKAFMAKVKSFKKHSHGTFVAGIALREGENINLFPIRGLNLPSPVVVVEDSGQEGTPALKSKTPEEKFNEEIKLSMDRVIKKFSKICLYLSINRIDVVNASYGITYKNITTKFRDRYKELTGKDIDEPQLQIVIKNYFDTLFRRTTQIIQKYPKLLFVFSAGNSGIDNDLYPHYPSKIRLPNTISVAALNGEFLASFSNYGKEHVDIAAPGVAILSLVPTVYSADGKEIYSPSSGTSMAAPYISNLAAQILNVNPKLKPGDVKKIILETGDEKEQLKGKLISGAMVNNEKALKAALLSLDMGIGPSIALATSGLIPMQDFISIRQAPIVSPEKLKNKLMEVIPKDITQGEIEEIQSTNEESSLPLGPKKETLDNSTQLPSVDSNVPKKVVDPIPSSQMPEQSPPPGEDLRPSFSPTSLQSPETQDQVSEPSLP